MTISDRIVAWNKDRCIPQEFNLVSEAAMLSEELTELLQAKTEHDIVDALDDLRVLIEGAIWKLGYDIDITMNETLLEIEDRGGYYNVDQGKWLKVKKPDAYKADYSKAKFR